MKYEINLPAYSGPLDLLLALISKAKIEIKDIFISQITEQYLEYITQEGAVDMDSASDFVQMAATLLYIKSRALLPGREDDLDEDGLTPEEKLVKRLYEYKQYKEASLKLYEMQQKAAFQYYKLPEELTEEDAEEIYINADTQLLADEFAKMISRIRAAERRPREVVYRHDHYSVKEQIRQILARLTIQPEMTFRELLSEEPCRDEVAVTFLSMLQLMNQSSISVKQDEIFGEITVQRNRNEGKEQ